MDIFFPEGEGIMSMFTDEQVLSVIKFWFYMEAFCLLLPVIMVFGLLVAYITSIPVKPEGAYMKVLYGFVTTIVFNAVSATIAGSIWFYLVYF